jgi:hypothetical protein
MAEAPEQKARREIDAKLVAAGWIVQDRDELDLTAGRGIAVREFKMKPGFGFADFLLYVDRKAIGAVEAIAKRDKLSLDLFWIKDKSLTDTDSLPEPSVLATEIVDELEAALAQLTKIAARLKPKT